MLNYFPLLSQLFKTICLEADAILNELQSSLSNQEEKLATYAQLQREVELDNSASGNFFFFKVFFLFLFIFKQLMCYRGCI